MTNRFIEHVTDTEADLPSRVHFHLCVYMLDAMAAGGHSSQPELAQGCSRVSCRGRCRRAARPARGHAIPLSPSPLSNTVKLLACPPLPTRLISDPGYAGHSFNLFAPAVFPPPHVVHGRTGYCAAWRVVGRSRRGATGSQANVTFCQISEGLSRNCVNNTNAHA